MNPDAFYEDIELRAVQSGPSQTEQQYASLTKERGSDNIYQDIQTVNKTSTNTTAPPKKEKKIAAGQKSLWVIAFIAMVAFILAVVGIIITAGLYVSALQENAATLTRRIEELEVKLNQTQESKNNQQISLVHVIDKLNSLQNTTTEQLSSLQSSVDTLNTAKNTALIRFNSLQSSVDTLTTDRDTTMAQLSSLQSSVDTLNTGRVTTTARLSSLQASLNTLNTGRDTTTDQLSNLQSSVNTLTTRVNSPVNLYQNCIQDTRSCTGSQSGYSYFKSCTTGSLPTSITVSLFNDGSEISSIQVFGIMR